jgi:excisionase family DNA binding protein
MTAPKHTTWVTVPEITTALHVSPMTVYRWIHKGDLPAVRLGKRSLRVRNADVAAFVRASAVGDAW